MSNVSRFLRGVRPTALLTRFSPTSTWASFATAALDDGTQSQPSTSGQTGPQIIGGSKELSAASVGAYYSLDRSLLPEAGRPYAGAFYSPREPGHERRGGCKALQQEVQATGAHAVMYRPVMHALFDAVDACARGAGQQQQQPQQLQSQRLLLSGPAGAGKSIALVGLVEWARQQGWLVLYVPSCSALVQGGYFSRRGGDSSGNGGGGRWDTLTSAQQLLKGVLDAHGPQLKKMPLQAETEAGAGAAAAAAAAGAAPASGKARARGGTLHDLVTRALASDDNAELAVDSVLELVRQLAAASSYGSSRTPVLFALDDYNCLYGATDYGWYSPNEDPRKARRRPIHTDDLVLASGLRLMDEQRLGGATVVAATCTAAPLPVPSVPPLNLPYTELRVPGFSEAETRNALAHYHATGYASALATSRQARQLHALTQGNARELRVAASTLGLQLS